jgi:hypothetical protein
MLAITNYNGIKRYKGSQKDIFKKKVGFVDSIHSS